MDTTITTPTWDNVADPATRAALDWPAYLALVAASTVTDLGRTRLATAPPLASLTDQAHHAIRFAEIERLLLDGALIAGVEEELAPLAAGLRGRADLDGRALVVLAAILDQLERLRLRLRDDLPSLTAQLAEVPVLSDVVRRTGRTLDGRGDVRDDASPLLVRLREDVRRRRDSVYATLREVMESHRDALADDTFPVRDGRVVLVVQSGARGRLDGLLHGRSGTGRSLYVEPIVAVEANNALRQATDEEAAERQRVLRELADAWRAALPAIDLALATIADLDALQAAARFAARCDARLCAVAGDDDLRLSAARHPLLEPRLESVREEALGSPGHRGAVVPLDLDMPPTLRALGITGPNAGGKTVALKTVGLAVLAARAGLPFPAHHATIVPWVGRLVATIGDDQDVLQERSTFSGRLERIRTGLDLAAPGSLVLLDELGSGTDPEEGAALGAAIVEALLAAGARVLLTTHLAILAAHLGTLGGTATAAMDFDPDRGQPRFRLRIGPPSGSQALALARRLGYPEALTNRAEALLGVEAARLRRTLAEVEALREELRQHTISAELARRDLERERETLERERQDLAATRREVGRDYARRLESFRIQVRNQLATEQDRLEEALLGGRRRGLVTEAVERLFEDAPTPPPEPAGPAASLVVGTTVRHRTLGWSGKILEVDPQRGIEVLVGGGMRLRLRPEDLLAGSAPPPPQGHSAAAAAARRSENLRRPPSRVALPDTPEVAGELMLVGRRVEDALSTLDEHLDRAARAGTERLRIVHGHGTGRLRRAVREHLRHHPVVVESMAAERDEGGDGATIAILAR